MKREHTTWGARKIRERLIRRFSGIKIPAKSTIHAVLDRHGLVERRGRTWRVAGTFCTHVSGLDREMIGGRDRVRTCDPLLAKQVLSQLSYTPTVSAIETTISQQVRLHQM